MITMNERNQIQTLAQAPAPQVDVDRKRAMDVAWKAYRGEFPKALKVDPDQPDDNVNTNRCAPIVDKGTSFLFGQTIQLECDQQDVLDGIWGDDDDRMTRLAKIAMNGGMFGQVFLKLIPAQGMMKYPRIVNLDPRYVRIVTDPQDCDVHLAYVIEYPGSASMQQRQIIARIDPNSDLSLTGADDMEDSWTITNYQRRDSYSPWLQVDASEDWPFPFAPIFTTQNLPNPNDPWGRPDLTEDLIQMNRVLNFVLSCFSRILKYHGHPKTIAQGVVASQISIAINDVLCLPSPDSKMYNLEMTSNLQSFLDLLADLRTDMDEQSRVPAVALGRLADLPRGQISGVALQLLFQPLIEKTVQKQRLYGCMIREISRAALIVSNYLNVSQYEDYDIAIHWQNLLPVDDLNAAQAAILKQQLGYSNATLITETGGNPEEEAEKKAEEDAAKMTNYSRGQGLPPVQTPQPGDPVPPDQAPANAVAPVGVKA